MTVESEYYKKIKLLNDEISILKSQAYEKDKTFSKENEKYDEYVKLLLKGKNELENKNEEFLKKINDLDNRLRKAGQTNQTLRMLLPKEDNVNTGKQGLGFENQNDDRINTRVRNQLSDEFEPLVKNINLQINFFEKSLVKEIKDDLKYVMSLEDDFDETCLLLDIQQEFFKTQFESVKYESYSHVYENEIFEQNSSLENENRCLKKTISQIQKDFSKMEAESIAFEITYKDLFESIQSSRDETNQCDDVKHKFDFDEIETQNIELEHQMASLVKENEHLKVVLFSISQQRMEILPVLTSNSNAVGDLRDPIWIKLVSTGYRFCNENKQVRSVLTELKVFKMVVYQDYKDKDCQGRLLDGFQDDIKYEHVGPKIQDRKKAKYYKDDQVMMKDLKDKVKRQRQRKDQDHKSMIGTKGASTPVTQERLKIKT
ncbi:hypothetical protein Tco_0084155 [Tanacetum coccineum]